MVAFDRNAPWEQNIIIDTDEFQEFWREVKTVDRELSKQLRKSITRVVRPITLDVRAAALAIPSNGGSAAKAYNSRRSGTKRPGLRQGLAAATEQKVVLSDKSSFAVRIRISGKTFAGVTHKTRTLPRYMEGLGRKFQRWRHPVFAHKKSWTGFGWTLERRYQGGTWRGAWEQQDQHPFLLPTVNKHRQEVLRAIDYAFQTAMRSIGFK